MYLYLDKLTETNVVLLLFHLKKKTKIMTMEQILENLYTIFSVYKAPEKIKTFNCISCISDEHELLILNTPLRELNESILGFCFEACNVGRFPSNESKYFIPRLLELLAIEVGNKSFSFIEYFFQCFSFLEYQKTFKPNEINAINAFFDAYLEREFFSENAHQDSYCIVDVALAGYDAVPFLKKLKSNSKEFSFFKTEMELHIEHQKKLKPLHYDNFEQWAKLGKINLLITYLNEN